MNLAPTCLVRTDRLVTVGPQGTLRDAAMLIRNGVIARIGPWRDMRGEQGEGVPVFEFPDHVITPSLVDCHTHLLEYAPPALFPVTEATHGLMARRLLGEALASGITALGEQICGYHKYSLSPQRIRSWAADMPMDICFSSSSLSIGFATAAHYSAATGSRALLRHELVDPDLVRFLARHSDYPGENLFINSTPANFAAEAVPSAGEIIYTAEQLAGIVRVFHGMGKKIGAHVAGDPAMRMVLDAGFDVVHHAHGISPGMMRRAADRGGVSVVATPIGGTHLPPNSPQEIVQLMQLGIDVAISTDAYLPAHEAAHWLPDSLREPGRLIGPQALMAVAQPAMRQLQADGFDENAVLAMLTHHPASILGKAHRYGSLQAGREASFLACDGVPGLEIDDERQIACVVFRGETVMDRLAATA